MKNLIAFLTGMLAYVAGIVMIICWHQSFYESTINPELIESTIDKIGWTMVCLGCAGVYLLLGVKLTIRESLSSNKKMQAMFLIMMFIFVIGLYYVVVFNCPW